MPFGNTHNKHKLNFKAEFLSFFPALSKHNNHMAKALTLEIYKKLRDKETPSGFTLDTTRGGSCCRVTWKRVEPGQRLHRCAL